MTILVCQYRVVSGEKTKACILLENGVITESGENTDYILGKNVAFVNSSYYWNAKNGTWWCDDGGEEIFENSPMDFWKIYVR